MSRMVALKPAYAARMADRHRMLVAKKTVTVKDEDGNPELLEAGKSRVVAGHFLTRTYPHLFAPSSEAAKYRTRQQTTGPRRENWRSRLRLPTEDAPPKWKPLVRLQTWAEPTFTVRLSHDVYNGMSELAYSEHIAAGRRGGGLQVTRETGGALFGIPARDREDSVTVREAGRPGPNTRTSHARMHVDCDHIRREAIALERSGSPRRHIGHWHTHPDTTGAPSKTDLQFFAWDCREWSWAGRSMQHYVALILTPTWEEDGYTCKRYASWAKPAIHAWHMQAVADDQFIVTPARVER